VTTAIGGSAADPGLPCVDLLPPWSDQMLAAAGARTSGSGAARWVGSVVAGQRAGGEVQVTTSEARWIQPPPTPSLLLSNSGGDLGVGCQW
jgi:hypothetical protein